MKTGIEWLKLKINNPTLPKKKKKKGYGTTRTLYIAGRNAK